jgi:exopolyphosphatase/guanosine-5'-triphosphate,3'-diphosphate pyrophosphatase
LAELRYFSQKKLLQLILSKKAEGLFGEVAVARFNSLAQSLGCETTIKISA